MASPQLHWVVTGHQTPTEARRFIIDTNVVSPALRYLIGIGPKPAAHQEEVFDAVRLRVAPLAMSTRTWVLDTRLAVIEMSRNNGRLDRDTLARLLRTRTEVEDWLLSASASASNRLAEARIIRRGHAR